MVNDTACCMGPLMWKSSAYTFSVYALLEQLHWNEWVANLDPGGLAEARNKNAKWDLTQVLFLPENITFSPGRSHREVFVIASRHRESSTSVSPTNFTLLHPYISLVFFKHSCWAAPTFSILSTMAYLMSRHILENVLKSLLQSVFKCFFWEWTAT